MKHSKSIHSAISRYLDAESRTYITDEFAYASYTAPHTMFSVSNDLPEILLSLSPSAMKLYLRTISLLRRNPDPVIGCTAIVRYELYKGLISRRSFPRAKAELVSRDLLIPTADKKLFIVNVEYCNKLYKPKVDIE